MSKYIIDIISLDVGGPGLIDLNLKSEIRADSEREALGILETTLLKAYPKLERVIYGVVAVLP